VKRQVPLSVGACSGEGVEPGSRSAALVSLLDHQLPFLDPGHELDTGEGGLGCLERFAPEPGSWDPLHSALVLLHEMMELWDLAHADGRAVRLVVALDGRFLGRAAGARARLRSPRAPERLLPEPQGRRRRALLWKQTVHRLALLIDGTREIAPHAFAREVRLVPPPTAPHRPLPAVERLLHQGTVLHDPTVDGRVVARPPPVPP